MRCQGWGRCAARLLSAAGPLVFGGPLFAQSATAVAPTAPAGFTVQVFAEGLGAPRGLALGPDGSLYVADSGGGRVLRLADRDGDGVADVNEVLIEGLDEPSGLAWHGGALWIAEATRISRFGFVTEAESELDVVVADLPRLDSTLRSLVFDPSGQGLFVSIGSSCDVCNEDDPRRGTVVLVSLDGERSRVWARGLHDAGGLAVHPETWELWALEHGRDDLGDDLPPDELNVVQGGRDYGWPFCYGSRIPAPEYSDPARCDVTELPVMTLPAHSTPLGLAFYDGEMFPSDYRGDAFVALHGPRNHSVLRGYKVVRLHVDAGRPRKATDFLVGWTAADGIVVGRPVQPLVGPDGALYVSDDHSGRVWRVAYETGEQPAIGLARGVQRLFTAIGENLNDGRDGGA